MKHVQGNTTLGHRLLHEDKTIIIPLMRSSEPIALGISETFPQARFRYAKEPEDLKPEFLEEMITVILVDSVINNRTSIVKFVKQIRALNATLRIVVVAAVAQRGAVKEGGRIVQALTREEAIGLSIVTFRVSENKYTGRGGNDTGHRLFNTTHLD
jgi:uracil phosphoribosyltransferase